MHFFPFHKGVHNLTGMSIGQSSYADYIAHIDELTSFALKSTSDMPNDQSTSTHHGASARMPFVDFRLSCSGMPRLPVFCATPWGSLSSINSLDPDFSPMEGNASTQPTVLSPRADTVPVSSVCHIVPGCGVCTGDGSTSTYRFLLFSDTVLASSKFCFGDRFDFFLVLPELQ